jgi:hypothetical protein
MEPTGLGIYQTSLKEETIAMGTFTQQLVALTISTASFHFISCKHKSDNQN